MSLKLGPKPLKCPHCGEWARSPEEVKKIRHKASLFAFKFAIVSIVIIMFVITVPSVIHNSVLYPLADFEADISFSDFSSDENGSCSEKCNITFMATGGYRYSDFNDLYIRLNFPDFCNVAIIKVIPNISAVDYNYSYVGWYSGGIQHHIDYSTLEFCFDPYFDGVIYLISLEVIWDDFDVRANKYGSSLNHQDYWPYVLPDRHETFNHLTDFILNGYSPDEYRFDIYIEDVQADWYPIWEGLN